MNFLKLSGIIMGSAIGIKKLRDYRNDAYEMGYNDRIRDEKQIASDRPWADEEIKKYNIKMPEDIETWTRYELNWYWDEKHGMSDSEYNNLKYAKSLLQDALVRQCKKENPNCNKKEITIRPPAQYFTNWNLAFID